MRFASHVLIALSFICTCLSTSAYAATYWQVSTGDWSTGSNWNGGEPDSSTFAYVNNGGTAKITQNGEAAWYLIIGENTGDSGTVEVKSGRINVDEQIRVGSKGTGTIKQTGGTLWAGSQLYLGYYSGSTGVYNHSGGDNYAMILYVGYNGSQGTYNLSGTGQLKIGTYIGYGGGTGELVQTGGTISKFVIIGSGGGTGSYSISAGTANCSGLQIGDGGTGSLNISHSSAQVTVGDVLLFGTSGTFTCVTGTTVNMTGGLLDAAEFINESQDSTKITGLSNLTFTFEDPYNTGSNHNFEVAGAEDGGFVNNFATKSFVIGVTNTADVKLVDDCDNGNRAGGNECLFLHELTINSGSTLDLNALKLYLEGDVETQVDQFIADNKLIDTTLVGDESLDAVYDSNNLWTTMEMVVVPPTPGDFEPDGDVDWDDLNFFVSHWLDTDCNDAAGDETNWCYGTDIDHDSNVGFCDFAMLADNWLEGVSEPSPEPFYEDFNDGLPTDGWDYYSSDGGGRIQVVNGRLRMDRDPSGTYTLNETVLHLDLEGCTNVVLTFYQAESGDELHSLPATFTGHENGDGVSVSSDGITWYQVVNASELNVDTVGQIFTVNLDDVGIAYTSDFRIKFQQYDNYPWSSDGREFDNIEVTLGGA